MSLRPADSETIRRHELQALFDPRSVVVVGASPALSRPGGRLAANIVGQGFSKEAYFVNPRHSEILGRKCFSSIAELPESPELAVIMVPTLQVVKAVEDVIRSGAKAVAVLSAGFAETGTDQGRRLEDELRSIAADSGVPVLGPNCAGFINVATHLAITNAAALLGAAPMESGNTAVVSQSSGIALGSVIYRGLRAGLRFNSIVTTGNETVLDAVDILQDVAHRPDVKVIGLALEGFRRPEALRAALRQCDDYGKSVVVLKVGRSDLGAKAAMSHTAALTGDDRMIEGMLSAFHVLRATDYRDFVDALLLLSRLHATPSLATTTGGVGVVTVTGGQSALFADLCGVEGVELPMLSSETSTRLTGYVESEVVANPVDLTGAGATQSGALEECVEILTRDANIDYAVPILTVSVDYLPILTALDSLARSSSKSIIVLWAGGDLKSNGAEFLRGQETVLPWCESPHVLARVLGYLTNRSSAGRMLNPEIGPAQARRASAGLGDSWLSPGAAWRSLVDAGISIPRQQPVTTPGEAVAFAQRNGYPICLKLEAPELTHKAERGAVRLELSSPEDLIDAFHGLSAIRAEQEIADARILAQETVRGVLEIIASVFRDEVLGEMLMVGIGGSQAELIRDVAFTPVPCEVDQIRVALSRLRCGWVFDDSYRGPWANDVPALCRQLVGLSYALLHRPDITEIEVNPIILRPPGAGCIAVDVLVRTTKGPIS